MSLLVQLSHTQYRQNLRVPQILYESEGGIHRLDMDTFPKTCARAVSLNVRDKHQLASLEPSYPNLFESRVIERPPNASYQTGGNLVLVNHFP